MLRDKISLENNTAEEIVHRMNDWQKEIELTRSVMLGGDGVYDEFFMTPGAFTRLYAVADQLLDTHLGRNAETTDASCVGKLFGIPCRSPIFERPDRRDLEGLADFQLEYRIIGDGA